MKSVFSWFITALAIMFWIFRVVVTILATFEVDFIVVPSNINTEITLLFLTLPCLLMIIKRNIIGGIVYFGLYGWYFGSELATILENIFVNNLEIIPASVATSAMVCIAAVFSSVLNVLDSFGVPSITPIVLNACIIASLFCGVAIFGKSDIENIALSMCFGWLVGGVLQMVMPAYCLIKKGWKFKFDLKYSEEIKSLYALFIPALIGAAVVQLNIFISKLLAFNLNNDATQALYISSRILEFPLGVFSIAIATVYFPRLAKLAAQKLNNDFKKEYDDGLIASMAISIPAMFGIIVLAKEILGLLFQWGLFSIKDVDICLPVLIASVIGLPFFAFTTYATRGFHSNSDTKTPVKISYIAIALNIVLSVIFMFKFGTVGLALANVSAAIFTSIALHFKLKQKFEIKHIYSDMLKIILASVIMALVCFGIREIMCNYLSGRVLYATACAVIIPVGSITYLVVLKILKFQKLSEFKKLIKRK